MGIFVVIGILLIIAGIFGLLAAGSLVKFFKELKQD